jgi:flagellar basal body-associated protein FliL
VYVNDGIALVVIFLSIVVIVLGVIARKQAEQAISRTTLSALVVSGLALLTVGILSLKLVSEDISNNASNRIAREELHSQLIRIENSIHSLNARQTEAEVHAVEEVERLNEALNEGLHRDHQDRNALSVLGSEIVWLKFLAVRDNGVTEYLRTYSGTYSIGKEVSAFIPCARPEGSVTSKYWAINYQPDVTRKEQFYQLVKGAYEASIPITFTGVLSPEGRYGHMGGARHLFIVMDAEKRDKDSCEHPWFAEIYEPDAGPRLNF